MVVALSIISMAILGYIVMHYQDRKWSSPDYQAEVNRSVQAMLDEARIDD